MTCSICEDIYRKDFPEYCIHRAVFLVRKGSTICSLFQILTNLTRTKAYWGKSGMCKKFLLLIGTNKDSQKLRVSHKKEKISDIINE